MRAATRPMKAKIDARSTLMFKAMTRIDAGYHEVAIMSHRI